MAVQDKIDAPNETSRLIERNDCLFTAGGIAIVAGLFFPVTAGAFDVLLIFSICLTIAVIAIGVSAKSTSQVHGFGLLVLSATVLRMALAVTAARLILSQADAGKIVNLSASLIYGENAAGAVTVFCILSAIGFWVVCANIKSIKRSGQKFITETAPLRQMSVESELNTGLIDTGQAQELRENISSETGFFVVMTGMTKFLRCAAVVELVVIIIMTTASAAVGIIETSTRSSPATYVSCAIAAGTIGVLSALLVTVAARFVVYRSSGPAVAEDELEVEVEVSVKPEVSTEAIAGAEIEVSANSDIGDLWVSDEIRSESDYAAIAELIEQKCTPGGVTLMASDSIDELSVTVPVNAMMHLAAKGRRCLLVDLDVERNSILNVFDIEKTTVDIDPERAAIASGIDNIEVTAISKDDIGAVGGIIGHLKDNYDCIIVYAPDMRAVSDPELLAENSRVAMLFGPDRQVASVFISDLRKMLLHRGCEVVGSVGVVAGAA